VNTDAGVATFVAFPTTAPQDDATLETIKRLRADVFPPVLEQSPASAHVGGTAASFTDIGDQVNNRLALFMIAVFFGFVLGEDSTIKMSGLGLAVAILVDATIVRMILVPASMTLMGNANWWIPGWLDRLLPPIDIEGEAGLPAPDTEVDVVSGVTHADATA